MVYTTDNGAETFCGRTAGPRRSAARRTRIGRERTGFRRSSGGPGSCSRAPRLTRSSRRRIGSRRWSQRSANPTSPTSCYKATARMARHSKYISMATTNATSSPARVQISDMNFFYWTDDGNLLGPRYDQWKAVFMEQNAHGIGVWQQPLVELRAPKIFNLRSDPFERADYEAGGYGPGGSWTTSSFCLFQPRLLSPNTCRVSGNFRLVRNRGASRLDQVIEKADETGYRLGGIFGEPNSGWAAPLALHWWCLCSSLAGSVEADEPDKFVGMNTCGECHAAQTALWRRSHHALAMSESHGRYRAGGISPTPGLSILG